MKIYIMRHGDAATREEAGVSTDEERPLTERGRRETAIMGQVLDKLGVAPDLLLSSPLVRAQQTAGIMAEHFGVEITNAPELAPGGSLAGVLAQILRHGRPPEVILVGHMPGVAELAGYLVSNQRDSGIHFRTAGICSIGMQDDRPAPGYGDLRWMIPPKIGELLI